MYGNAETESASPFLFSDYLMSWLESALDYGMSEWDFWNMTLAEVVRFVESKQRIQKIQAQEKATFDYRLADLIGSSISRIYSSTGHMPTIEEAYPTLFDTQAIQEQQQQQKDQLSAIRFKQFAESYNKRFNGGAKKE